MQYQHHTTHTHTLHHTIHHTTTHHAGKGKLRQEKREKRRLRHNSDRAAHPNRSESIDCYILQMGHFEGRLFLLLGDCYCCYFGIFAKNISRSLHFRFLEILLASCVASAPWICYFLGVLTDWRVYLLGHWCSCCFFWASFCIYCLRQVPCWCWCSCWVFSFIFAVQTHQSCCYSFSYCIVACYFCLFVCFA